MRRRRRNKSISFMTAVVVEVGTMLGIVAVAQPTWTRSIIEHVATPAASAVVELSATMPQVLGNPQVLGDQRSIDRQAQLGTYSQWPSAEELNVPAMTPIAASTAATTVGWHAASWNQASPHVARLESPANSSWVGSRSAQTEPALPPPTTSFNTPPWGSGNGWVQTVSNR